MGKMMKKKVLFLLFAFCGAGALFAQNMLPYYDGFWKWHPRKINILDLIEFYPDKLPYLRNEIFACYGRPFVNKIYQNYFRSEDWYQEKSDFSESWLPKIYRDNAEFISAVERSIQSIDEVIPLVLKNIEYKGGRAVLTFTSRQELVWTDRDVDFGTYELNGYGSQTMPWCVMGDWILLYKYRTDGSDNYHVIAYKLHHQTKKIIDSVIGNVRRRYLEENLLVPQGRTTVLPEYRVYDK